ncbi:MAG: hypothetical protein K0R17_3177 [Rariglobus sp.]|jgi:hypothetical protein|nr:hypothetical protein [Rariglobus sp.]
MKNRLLLTLFATTALLHAQPVKFPIFEANFNGPGKGIELVNGAVLGAPGSGVSGKSDDRAYVGTPASTEQERNGPVAVARKPIAPNALSVFTCTFWYYLDETGPVLQVPLSTAGILFLMHDKGFELRIENQPEVPRAYVFTPGLSGPCAGWRDRKQWIFAAFSWEQKTNTLIVFQGTPKQPVAYMRDMTGPMPANASMPREDLGRDPETIGNTSRTLDRPLAGKMDNVRFYDRVLEQRELEIIRKADLANQPVK